MAKDFIFEFTDRAQFSLGRLPNSVKMRVNQALHKLQMYGFRSPYAQKIPYQENTYLARATNDIRIIFSKEDDVITILDIVPHDKLRQFGIR